MTSTELFAAMEPALASEILEFNHANDRRLYKSAVEAVAQARKVRPVFIERQPRPEQHALLLASLGRSPFNMAADALLRNWLLKKHRPLLTNFLDALNIKHEQGAVEDLPKTVETAALMNAVESLLAKHPHDVVAVYLSAFNSMNTENWANLDAALHEDPRLELRRKP